MSEQTKAADGPQAASKPGAQDKPRRHAGSADAAEPAVANGHGRSASAQDGAQAQTGHQAEEEAAPGSAPAAAAGQIAELEAKLAEKDARLEATLSQYKEALDEFHRVKARLTRDVAKEIRAGKRQLLVALLEVVDNLERAIDAAAGDPAQGQSPLCQGVTMVRDQFHAKLQAVGVNKQPALGQSFDPMHFEAISNVATTDPDQDGKVVGVVRDAYVLDGETLRHGIVAVGKLQ